MLIAACKHERYAARLKQMQRIINSTTQPRKT